MFIASCLGFLEKRSVCSEKCLHNQWQHFVAEVDVKKQRIFCRNSHPDEFCNKGSLKYLEKLTGKHVYRSFLLKR